MKKEQSEKRNELEGHEAPWIIQFISYSILYQV